jgi:hypothetical protein
MHTVELLEKAVALAGQLGFVVRQDWLGGGAAGACELQGRRWLVIDLALSPAEQLDQVIGAIADLGDIGQIAAMPELRRMINLRRAA